MIKRTSTSAFWESENKQRGTEYQWGGLSPAKFAHIISQHCSKQDKLLILVCGAGMSKDALSLQKVFKHANVLAVDFTRESVEYQKSLGVTSLQVDLLRYNKEWKGKFDVVIDASFTDVFTSDWKDNDNAQYNKQSLRALANILRYVKQNGGLFVVNTIVQTDDEFRDYVSMATKNKLIYNPQTVMKASDIDDKNRTRVNRWGRVVKGMGSSNGHVGFWTLGLD